LVSSVDDVHPGLVSSPVDWSEVNKIRREKVKLARYFLTTHIFGKAN